MRLREFALGGPLLTVRELDDVALANQMMLWAGIRHLPVVGDGSVVGVVSESDLLRALGRASREALRWPMRRVMSAPATVIGPDADVSEAAALMVENRIGCLPIVSAEGALLGIVTRTDVMSREALAGLAQHRASDSGVRAAMRSNPVTVHEDDDLMEAALRMQQRGIRHLPVVDGLSRVVGMLSDQDVRAATGVAWLHGDEPEVRLRLMKVADAMSSPPVTVTEPASLVEAARWLMEHRIGALPVVDTEDRLLGIVSYVDLLALAYKPMGGART